MLAACSGASGQTTATDASGDTDPATSGTTAQADSTQTATTQAPPDSETQGSTTTLEPTTASPTTTLEPTTDGTTAVSPATGDTSTGDTTSVGTSTGETTTDDTTSTDTSTSDTSTSDTTDPGTSTGVVGDCSPGDSRSCYGGPDGTDGVGKCKAGEQQCGGDGTWGPCEGEVLPQPESCETPGDEDCDGVDPCSGDGVYRWHKAFGGVSDERGVRVGFDGTGAVVLAAQGVSTIDFGGGPLQSAGSWDLFLAKFAPDGAHLWSKSFGDGASQFGDSWALAVSPAGDIVVGGAFAGTMDLGGAPLVNQSSADGFLAKFDADGAHVWSKAFKAGAHADPQALALGPDGSIHLVGKFRGGLDLGGGWLVPPSQDYDAFVGKFTAAGAHVWSLRYGDFTYQDANGVAVDAAGNSYVGGSLAGTMDPGNGPLISAGQGDAYLVKFSPTGNAVWAQRYGDAEHQAITSVTIAPSGRVSVTGTMAGEMDLGGGPIYQFSFAAQFDGSGAHQWSKSLGSGIVTPTAIVADGLGSLFVAGHFIGGADFGGGPLNSQGEYDVFALRLGPDGAHVWSRRFGDFTTQMGLGAAGSKTGAVAMTGGFHGSINLGGGPVASKGNWDGFVVVFDP